MQFTDSYRDLIPEQVLRKYDWLEQRDAATLLHATNPEEFTDLVMVLDGFSFSRQVILGAGGNRSDIARDLDDRFRRLGWREGKHDTEIRDRLVLREALDVDGTSHAPAEEIVTTVVNEGYWVDNVKGKVRIDVEWNAKDGNLDRDLALYRTLYDQALISGAVIITRDLDLRDFTERLGERKYDSTTTTTMQKLRPRLARGAAGGCPLLAIAITERCYVPEHGEPAYAAAVVKQPTIPGL